MCVDWRDLITLFAETTLFYEAQFCLTGSGYILKLSAACSYVPLTNPFQLFLHRPTLRRKDACPL